MDPDRPTASEAADRTGQGTLNPEAPGAPRKPVDSTEGISTSTVGASEARVKAIPALTPYPGTCHVVGLTAWRESGFASRKPYSNLKVAAPSGTAKVRHGPAYRPDSPRKT
jgi:hypothetical protein